MVPGVTVTGNTYRNNVIFILNWREPFNNLDPIVKYTVSCSGDDACPPSFTTTDNTTRSYTFTNLTPMTSYIFSVVATNSIGSGEASVVMITTPPSSTLRTTTTTTSTTTSTNIASTTSTNISTEDTTTISSPDSVTISILTLSRFATTSSIESSTVSSTRMLTTIKSK